MPAVQIWLFPGGGLRALGRGLNEKFNVPDAARLLANLGLLAAIRAREATSIYGLAQSLGLDVSNLRKDLLLFERAGLISLEKERVNGRLRRVPRVHYEKATIHYGQPEGSAPKRGRALLRRNFVR